jgi:hypothetical protein
VAELHLERDKSLNQRRAQALRQAGDAFLDPGPLPPPPGRLELFDEFLDLSQVIERRLLMVPEILLGQGERRARAPRPGGPLESTG